MLWYLPFAAWATDVDLFVPAASLGAGAGTLQGEAPLLPSPGPAAALVASYSRDPVVQRVGDQLTPAVTALAPLDLQVGWVTGDLRVDLMLPVYAHVGAPLTGWSGPALGDLRLQATVPVGCDPSGLVCAAVVPRLTAPTGTGSALVAGGPSGGLVGAVGGRIGRLGWVGDLGARLAAEDAPGEVALGPGGSGGWDVEGLAGAWVTLGASGRVGAELQGARALAAGARTSGSAHLFAQAGTRSGLGVVVGGGVGLGRAVGTPSARGVGALVWTGRPDPGEPERAPARAGAAGASTDAPAGRSTASGRGAAPASVDPTGGRPDEPAPALMAARTLVPPVDPQSVLQIAPPPAPDADRDGVSDQHDRCPAAPGALRGCPDADGDEVADPEDPCPTEPGEPGSAGCPPAPAESPPPLELRVRLGFVTARSTLTPESLAALEEAARIVGADPLERRIEVHGHTDSVGTDEENLALSRARAEAVVAWLVERGVPRERLVAKGFGERLPLYSNRTPLGRQGNRRVELVSIEGPPPAREPAGR